MTADGDADARERINSDFVAQLQRDSRLLLHHVSGLPHRDVREMLTPEHVALLAEDPTAVAASREACTALIGLRDSLARAASPATARTVRITCHYLRIAPAWDLRLGDSVERRANALRWTFRAISVLGAVATLLALTLLSFADRGRQDVGRLAMAQEEVRAARAQIVQLPMESWREGRPDPPARGPWFDFCRESGRLPGNGPGGNQAQMLCSQVLEAEIRLNLAFLRLKDVNCYLHWVTMQALALGRGCARTPEIADGKEAPLLNAVDWHRTELRAIGDTLMITNYFLPLVMGFLGGAAFSLRWLRGKIRESTLDAQDGLQAGLRIVLATLMGGLLGALFGGEASMQVSGFQLTVGAAAFFVGFAVETIFRLIERLVGSVADRLATTAGETSAGTRSAVMEEAASAGRGAPAQRPGLPGG